MEESYIWNLAESSYGKFYMFLIQNIFLMIQVDETSRISIRSCNGTFSEKIFPRLQEGKKL